VSVVIFLVHNVYIFLLKG